MPHQKSARHGTDSGYYRHVRRPDPDNGWPLTACDECRAAHAAAWRKRTGGKPKPNVPKHKTCQVCGAPGGRYSTPGLCRSCAARARFDPTVPVHWKRVGMIWKAA